jgi:hypothetical protein
MPYFSRDSVLAVLALTLLGGVVAAGLSGKTIDRTYSVKDCVEAYRRAKTTADTRAVDTHLLHWGYRNRNQTFCIALRKIPAAALQGQ